MYIIIKLYPQVCSNKHGRHLFERNKCYMLSIVERFFVCRRWLLNEHTSGHFYPSRQAKQKKIEIVSHNMNLNIFTYNVIVEAEQTAKCLQV